MKKAYHICLSSGDEVCCRDEEDYVYYFNALALAIAKTESSLLADAVMSNHVHECLRTACPKVVATMQRYTYTRYFNSKYLRRGSLFLRPPFIIELEGLYHKLAALSYTLRNPVHHGVTSTPFEYRHSSARALFRDALGRDDCQDFLPEYLCHRYLPDHRSCPSGYKMGKNGLILRENVLDAEQIPYVTYDTLEEALPQLEGNLQGYADPDAVLTAPETRSSSPVRIVRDESKQSTGVKGLYPAGEGAGYAGGIMSAAIDGMMCAEALIEQM
jgi:hypothetical protein